MEKHLTAMESGAHGIPYQPFLFTIAWQMLSTVRTNAIACDYGQCERPILTCTCGGAAAMTIPERRLTYRDAQVPVFCPIHSALRDTNGHQAKSISMSPQGVYFVTIHPIFAWLPVQVLLRMPRQIARALPSERLFTGRLREVDWKDVPSGRSGVGVELFYWQTPQRAVQ